MGESPGQRRAAGRGATSRLSVRLNDRELLQLRQRARARGLSVTRLLVDAALAQPAEPGRVADHRRRPGAREPARRSRGSSSGVRGGRSGACG